LLVLVFDLLFSLILV